MDAIIVVGGGVAGLCVARHLQLAGRKVVVVDPSPVLGGASFGNGGFISAASFMPGAQPGMLRKLPGWLLDPLGPLAIHPAAVLRELPWFLRWLRAGRNHQMLRLARQIHKLHHHAFDDWRFLLGDALYAEMVRKDGEMVLWDSTEIDPIEAAEDRLARDFGYESHTLGPDELRRYYPGLSPEVKRGVVKLGNGHTLSPARLCLALADLLRRDGAEFVAQKVVKLLPQPDGFTVMTTADLLRAKEVVLAAGVWSRDLLRPLGVHVPLTSERGYHAMLPAGSVEIGMPFIHRGRGIGMTPMLEGVRVAGTVEFGGIDGVPDERRVDQAVAQARKLFPDMTATPQTFWSGQRPATPDTLPVLGSSGKFRNLWLCFGSGTYGMTQGPTGGRLVADLMLGRTPSLPPRDYAIDRF